jgi:excisionase family DNA binding protein
VARGNSPSRRPSSREGERKLVLSVEDAAAALSISRDTFERYVIAELRLIRLGRRLLVPVPELERWVDEHTGTPLIADLARIRYGRAGAGSR